MPNKFVVVWGNAANSQRWIPVDEVCYTDTPEEAKAEGRKLLANMREPGFSPIAILEISEEKFQSMLTGTTPLETFNADLPLEIELLQLAP
jgi:hypothetical protein